VAPPDRSDQPRRIDTRADIGSVDLNASADSRMSENALRLASWVEWLPHPEAVKKVVNDVSAVGMVNGALWHDLVQS